MYSLALLLDWIMFSYFVNIYVVVVIVAYVVIVVCRYCRGGCGTMIQCIIVVIVVAALVISTVIAARSLGAVVAEFFSATISVGVVANITT